MTDTRIALITGASRGLGRSMALHLATGGVNVVETYRNSVDKAAAVGREIEALGRRAAMLPLDVGRTGDFPAFVDTLERTLHDSFGRDRLDILINNAGIGAQGTIAENNDAEWLRVLNVNLLGVVRRCERQHLQCNATPQRRLPRLVHDAHPAPTNFAHQPVIADGP